MRVRDGGTSTFQLQQTIFSTFRYVFFANTILWLLAKSLTIGIYCTCMFLSMCDLWIIISFHSFQDVMISVQRNYQNFSETDMMGCQLLKSFLAIPLLPPAMMPRGYSALLRKPHQQAGFKKIKGLLFKHFRRWLRICNRENLSVYHEPIRTSNAREVANTILRTEIGNDCKSITEFLCMSLLASRSILSRTLLL